MYPPIGSTMISITLLVILLARHTTMAITDHWYCDFEDVKRPACSMTLNTKEGDQIMVENAMNYFPKNDVTLRKGIETGHYLIFEHKGVKNDHEDKGKHDHRMAVTTPIIPWSETGPACISLWHNDFRNNYYNTSLDISMIYTDQKETGKILIKTFDVQKSLRKSAKWLPLTVDFQVNGSMIVEIAFNIRDIVGEEIGTAVILDDVYIFHSTCATAVWPPCQIDPIRYRRCPDNACSLIESADPCDEEDDDGEIFTANTSTPLGNFEIMGIVLAVLIIFSIIFGVIGHLLREGRCSARPGDEEVPSDDPDSIQGEEDEERDPMTAGIDTTDIVPEMTEGARPKRSMQNGALGHHNRANGHTMPNGQQMNGHPPNARVHSLSHINPAYRDDEDLGPPVIFTPYTEHQSPQRGPRGEPPVIMQPPKNPRVTLANYDDRGRGPDRRRQRPPTLDRGSDDDHFVSDVGRGSYI